jgi:RimJ/RimL family protein N-acetyltransferase
MTASLGGPESAEQITARHERFLELPVSGRGQMFKIVNAVTDEEIGGVGYWEREWRGEQVYEAGWSVLPAFQRRGVARPATRQAIAMARAEGKHRYLHAFPLEDNPPSNSVCRMLGFRLVEVCDIERTPGHPIRCNDWRLNLFPKRKQAP